MTDHPPIHIYLHAAAMGDHWREIVAELVGIVEGSGLGDVAATKRCVIVGQGETRYLGSRWDGWETIETFEGLDRYEYPTLKILWEHATKNPGGRFLYLHTKGASSALEDPRTGAYAGKRFRDRWRRVMAYHLVTRWRERVDDLASADAVGCFPVGGPLPHYSGNFWWSRGDHLAKLPEPAPMAWGQPGGEHPRLWAELWLQSVPGRFTSCFNSPPCLDTAFLTGQYRLIDNKVISQIEAERSP